MRRKAGVALPIELAILAAARHLEAAGEPEVHGYALARAMRDAAGARSLTGHGTLYRALERMEAAGWLESRWEDAAAAAEERRPVRRLYRVTAAGADVLATQAVPGAGWAPA